MGNFLSFLKPIKIPKNMTITPVIVKKFNNVGVFKGGNIVPKIRRIAPISIR